MDYPYSRMLLGLQLPSWWGLRIGNLTACGQELHALEVIDLHITDGDENSVRRFWRWEQTGVCILGIQCI